jgi:SAM-dependent methyltransferase
VTFKDHFSGHARSYSDFRPHYPREVVSFLATIAPREGTVWDVGTGSGQLAGALGAAFARVVATDASEEQLRSAGPAPNVDYRIEPAERSSLPDGSVDLVTVAQAAHWFDLDRFYAEVRRVARPGAAIVLLGYELMTIEPRIDRIVEWFYKPVVGEFWPPERSHLETSYRNLAFPFEPIEAPFLELVHEWNRDQVVGYVGTWSAVAGYRKSRGEDPVRLFLDRLEPLWPDSAERRTVRWPLIVKAGRIG